ncbi:MAG: hypothetical protein K2H01_04175 [Ruminococcus sp.]|nr:hypothetical protein [Ruminococcus sp.]
MNNESYNRLFEIANKNMQLSGSGRTFDCRKAAFFYYINSDPYEIDALKLLEMNVPNNEFIDIAYIAFLGRLADMSEVRRYEKSFSLPDREFKRIIINDLRDSDEVISFNKKRFLNFSSLIENESNSSSKNIMLRFLPVYKRLPTGIKKYIRKMLGAGEQ